jgi:general secretion pathway protein K
VLWIIVAVGVELTLLGASVRQSLRLTDNDVAAMRGEALILSAVEIAVARLIATDERERWTAGDAIRQVRLESAVASIRVTDEGGKININFADDRLLAGLFTIATGSAAEGRKLAERVLDWRDRDDDRREFGAERRDYRRAGAAPGAANAPFLDVSDLGRVLGVSSDVGMRIQPYVTIFTRDGKINPMLASETVLRALPGVDHDTVKRIVELRRSGLAVPTEVEALLRPAEAYLSGLRGPAFRLDVRLDAATPFALGNATIVVAPALDQGAPYRVLAWRFLPSTVPVVPGDR